MTRGVIVVQRELVECHAKCPCSRFVLRSHNVHIFLPSLHLSPREVCRWHMPPVAENVRGPLLKNIVIIHTVLYLTKYGNKLPVTTSCF